MAQDEFSFWESIGSFLRVFKYWAEYDILLKMPVYNQESLASLLWEDSINFFSQKII